MRALRFGAAILLAVTPLALTLLAAGCASPQLAELQRQVQLQGRELQRQGSEIAALRQAQSGSTPAASTNQPAQPVCDKAVLKKALDQGDQQAALKLPQIAVFYYRDALGACPGDPQAQLRLAHIYEELGDRTQAIAYYRLVADGKTPALAKEARRNLARMGAH